MLPFHPHRPSELVSANIFNSENIPDGFWIVLEPGSAPVLPHPWRRGVPGIRALSAPVLFQSSSVPVLTAARSRNTPGWLWVGLCEGCIWVQGGQRGNSPRFCSPTFSIPCSSLSWFVREREIRRAAGSAPGFCCYQEQNLLQPFSVTVPPGEELVPNFPQSWHLLWVLSRAESGPYEGVCVSGWK